VLLVSLHTSPIDQPGAGNAGGMNTYVLQSALSLARLGLQVEIVTGARSVAATTTGLAERVRLHDVPLHLPDQPALQARAAAEFGATVIGLVPPCEVVHGHYWLSGLAGQVIAQRWDAAFLQSAHTLASVKSAALEGPGGSQARLQAERGLARVADRLVANTADEADSLVELDGAERARVVVVEPGVDATVFSPGHSELERATTLGELGLDPTVATVAYVGRLQPLKGPDVLLRAAAGIADRLASAGRGAALNVLVVGAPAGPTGDFPEQLAQLAAQLPDGVAVSFVPPQPAHRLARLYRSADVVVVPSRSESFGLVALEAQACGGPVVAARVGGLPRALGNGAGRLVDGHDPGDWAAAVAGLLTDPDVARVAGDAGRRHAAAFTWERTARGLVEVYRAAAADRRALSCDG